MEGTFRVFLAEGQEERGSGEDGEEGRRAHPPYLQVLQVLVRDQGKTALNKVNIQNA